MLTCGIDVGSRSTKAVVIDETGDVLGRGLTLTGGMPSGSAVRAMNEALLAAGIERGDVAHIAATGYGRRLVPDHDLRFTPVSCHAVGAYNAFPGTVNVLDIGAIQSVSIRLDENGHVHRFRLNDRCGSGVGRYLERVADTLEIPLEEIGQLALFSREPHPVPSVCSVLAETEVLNLVTREMKPADILKGVCDSLAERLASQVKQIWVPGKETTLTGGIAKNAGMVASLESTLGVRLNFGHDAEFMGAIGAALLSFDPQCESPSDTDSPK
ncbi:MAG: acyl-CoA dehydratase activase [bacterium]